MYLPLVRDLLPHVPVIILVDDMFVPFPYSYNGTVDAASTALVGICGAQTIALAASDGVGTLTGEDAHELGALLPTSAVPILWTRYVAGGDAAITVTSVRKGGQCRKGTGGEGGGGSQRGGHTHVGR